jgi:GR25 family glycosyltransferase involved in LPS biosynthesis
MSYINTLVDKVYVINLDKDVERLKTIDTALRKQGISYERLPATLGSNLSNDSRLTQMCNFFCTDGIKGCAVSHHRIWEDALRNGYSRVLVFEDDALIPDDFDKKVREVMVNVPEQYDIVFLGCQYFCRNKTVVEKVGHTLMGTTPEEVNEQVQKVSGSIGAHATIYTQIFMNKIINEPIETHIDVQIQRWIKTYGFNAYGLHPELVSTSDPMLSSNLADKFPPLLNKALGSVYVTDTISLAWALSENQMKIAGLNVNLYNILFFLLALVLPPWLSVGLFAWIGVEAGVAKDVWNGIRLSIFTTLGLFVHLGLSALQEGLRSGKF